MDDIIVYNDFLDNETMSRVINNVLNNGKWEFGHKSNQSKAGIPFWAMNLDENILFNKTILRIIESKTGKKYVLNRVYANGQTYGQNGSFHIDNDDPNTMTFCLYVCPEIHSPTEIVEGGLEFKLKELPDYMTLSIQSCHNRGVLFPSNYTHRGMSFGRFVEKLRCCIAWKLKVK